MFVFCACVLVCLCFVLVCLCACVNFVPDGRLQKNVPDGLQMTSVIALLHRDDKTLV